MLTPINVCKHKFTYVYTHTHADGGLDEMMDEMSGGKVLYAFLQVTDPNTQLPKNVLVNWVRENWGNRREDRETSYGRSLHIHTQPIVMGGRGDRTSQDPGMIDTDSESREAMHKWWSLRDDDISHCTFHHCHL